MSKEIVKTNTELETLQSKWTTLSENLLTYRAQVRGGVLKQTHLIKQTKREIARTIQALEHQSYVEAISNWLALYADVEGKTDVAEEVAK